MNRCQQRPNFQATAGLSRYQSAPSSYFTDILNCNGGDGARFGEDDFARLFNPNASSPETQRIFARFMNSTGTVSDGCSLDTTVQSQSQVLPPIKIEADSTLIRHGSLPAGIFAGMMDPISETGNKGFEEDNSGVPLTPLDDSTTVYDDLLKELAEDASHTFDKNAKTSDNQNNDVANRRTVLSHHLSLPPKSSAMKKLLQDLGPCKLRAKRGCATHPRSIAERVRRNRISERTRKLQELVPNMEMQTNTANMLDLAADYIKNLQRQVKTLSDNRAKCCCSAKLKM